MENNRNNGNSNLLGVLLGAGSIVALVGKLNVMNKEHSEQIIAQNSAFKTPIMTSQSDLGKPIGVSLQDKVRKKMMKEFVNPLEAFKEGNLRKFISSKSSEITAKQAISSAFKVMLNNPSFSVSPEESDYVYQTLHDSMLDDNLFFDYMNKFSEKYGNYLTNPGKQKRLASTFSKQLDIQYNYLSLNPSKRKTWEAPTGILTRNLDRRHSKGYFDMLNPEQGELAKKNFAAVQDLLNKHKISNVRKTMRLVEDTTRSGKALMMRLQIQDTYFDIPLAMNREAFDGTLSTKGGLAYQATSLRKGYNSPIAMGSVLKDYEGTIIHGEQLFLDQLDIALGQLSGASTEKAKRIKQGFIDATFGRGQRLASVINEPQKLNAILSTYLVKIDIPGFIPGDRDSETKLQKHTGLSNIDVNKTRLAEKGNIGRLEITAPNLPNMVEGYQKGDVMVSANVSSFRKDFILPGRDKFVPLFGTMKESDIGLLGYKDTKEVAMMAQNKRQVAVIYQFPEEFKIGNDSIKIAGYRQRRKIYEGSYLGKTVATQGVYRPIKKVSEFTENWAKILEPILTQAQDEVYIPYAEAEKAGFTIGRSETFNVIDINPRKGKIEGFKFALNKGNGELFYTHVNERDRYNKVKSFGIKGQIISTPDRTIKEEAVSALGLKRNDFRKIGVNVSNLIISDEDQIVRLVGGMKASITSGMGIYIAQNSNLKADPNAFKTVMNQLNNIGDIHERAKALVQVALDQGVNKAKISWVMAGYNYYLGKMTDKAEAENARKGFFDFLTSKGFTDEEVNKIKTAKGFIGVETLSYDQATEFQGAGNAASIERRSLTALMQTLSSNGATEKEKQMILRNVVSSLEGFDAENLFSLRAYQTSALLNTSNARLRKNATEYLDSYKAFLKANGQELNLLKIDFNDAETVMKFGPGAIFKNDEYRKAHLLEITLPENAARPINSFFGSDGKFYIPGGAGIPSVDKIQIKKDNKLVSIVSEHEQRMNAFLAILADPANSDSQILEETIRAKNFLGVSTYDAVINSTQGKVHGSVTTRSQSLYNVDNNPKVKDLYKQYEKDKYISEFLNDNSFMAAADSAKKVASKQDVVSNIKNFYFGKGVTGYVGRHPNLGEGHSSLALIRRDLANDSNAQILKNQQVQDLLGKLNPKIEASKKLEMVFSGDKRSLKALGLDKKQYKNIQNEFAEILYSMTDEMSAGEDFTTRLPIADNPFKYKLNGQDVIGDKFNLNAFMRKIGDTDGDTQTTIISWKKQQALADRRMLRAAANNQVAGTLRQDAIRKTIKARQDQFISQTNIDIDPFVEDVNKVVQSRNVAQFSAALDKIKISVANNSNLSIERKSMLDSYFVEMEENILKGKKKKLADDLALKFSDLVQKLTTSGDDYKEAEQAFLDILHTNIAAQGTVLNIDANIPGFDEQKITIDFDSMNQDLLDSFKIANKEGLLRNAKTKSYRNSISRLESDPETEYNAKILGQLDEKIDDLFRGKGGFIPSMIQETVDGTIKQTVNAHNEIPKVDGALGKAAEVATGVSDTFKSMSKKTWIGLGLGIAALGVTNYISSTSGNIENSPYVNKEDIVMANDSYSEIEPGNLIDNQTYISTGNDNLNARIETNDILKTDLYKNTLGNFGRNTFVQINDTRKPVTKNSYRKEY